MFAPRERGDDILAERAVLLDPTRDDPDQHVAFWLEDDRASGIAYPVSKMVPNVPAVPLAVEDTAAIAGDAERAGVSVRGAVSIQVYGLNRLHLVQERARLLQQLRFLEGVFLEVGDVSQSLAAMNVGEPQAQLTDAADHLDRLQARILDQMKSLAEPEAPHSAIAKAYLRDFRKRVALLPPD